MPTPKMHPLPNRTSSAAVHSIQVSDVKDKFTKEVLTTRYSSYSQYNDVHNPKITSLVVTVNEREGFNESRMMLTTKINDKDTRIFLSFPQMAPTLINNITGD